MGRSQKPVAPEENTADVLKIILDHFFPNFNAYLNQLSDPRDQDRITYSKELLYSPQSIFRNLLTRLKAFDKSMLCCG